MNELEELSVHQQQIYDRLPQIQERVAILKSQLDALSTNKSSHHWVACTANSNIVHKYQCTNCGFISTFQGMKCPKCQTKMR